MGSDLATHIIDLSECFHGLTSEKVKELAYEFAMVNKINIPDSWKTNKKAGKDWLLFFTAEYKLSVRQPEATSLGRATAFSAHNVSLFYSNLSDVMSRHQFPPNRIFNIDETGCSTVQNPAKMIACQGTHQVGSVASGERGRTVTMVEGINAAGGTISPMFIFPFSRITSHLETTVGANAPPMSKCSCFPTGWMTGKLFLSYLHHFKDYTQCSTENKCLLILDNHSSHISVQSFKFAKENGIVFLTIPPHTSGKLQLLDKCVYRPFKTKYNRAMNDWLCSNPGKTCSIHTVPEISKRAFLSSFTQLNIISAFRSTGIFPLNRDIWKESHFLPSALTDRPNPLNANEQSLSLEAQTERNGIAAEVHGSDLVSREVNDGNSDSVATTSLPTTSSNPDRSNPGFGPTCISSSSLLPLPKCGPRKINKKQRKGSTRILTDSPELRKLIISKQNSCRVKQKKRKKVVEKRSRKETNDQKNVQRRKEKLVQRRRFSSTVQKASATKK